MQGYLRNLQLRRMCAADGAARGRMNLQLFAGEGDNGGGTEGGGTGGADGGTDGGSGGGTEGGEKKQPEKMLTQSEVNRIVQETIAKERKKAEEARTEAEKLAKMTEQQRMQHEAEKREAELTKREKEITRRELRATAAETLAQKNLPTSLLDILDYTDAEACSKSIEAHEAAWRKAVQAGVEERLKGKPPKGGNGGNAGDNGRAELRKVMGLPTE